MFHGDCLPWRTPSNEYKRFRLPYACSKRTERLDSCSRRLLLTRATAQPPPRAPPHLLASVYHRAERRAGCLPKSRLAYCAHFSLPKTEWSCLLRQLSVGELAFLNLLETRSGALSCGCDCAPNRIQNGQVVEVALGAVGLLRPNSKKTGAAVAPLLPHPIHSQPPDRQISAHYGRSVPTVEQFCHDGSDFRFRTVQYSLWITLSATLSTNEARRYGSTVTVLVAPTYNRPPGSGSQRLRAASH